MKKTEFIAEPGKQETLYVRHFDATPEQVFKAYTDTKLIPQWWGPRNLSTIVDKNETRPGGTWRYINRDKAGQEFAFHGVFHEVSAPGRLVSTFEFEGTPGHVSLDTLTLEAQDGGTKLTDHTVFQSAGDRDEMLKADMEKGLSESMDRLAELLAKLQPAAAAKP